MESTIEIRNRRMSQLSEAWLQIYCEAARLEGKNNWEDAETGKELFADLDFAIESIAATGCWLKHEDLYSDMVKELFDKWMVIFEVCTVEEFYAFRQSIQSYIVEDFCVHFWALGTGEWMDRESPSKSEKDWTTTY